MPTDSPPLPHAPCCPVACAQAVRKMGPANTAAATMAIPGPQFGADLFKHLGADFAAGLLSALGPLFVGSLMRAAGPAAAGGFLRGMGPQCECQAGMRPKRWHIATSLGPLLQCMWLGCCRAAGPAHCG